MIRKRNTLLWHARLQSNPLSIGLAKPSRSAIGFVLLITLLISTGMLTACLGQPNGMTTQHVPGKTRNFTLYVRDTTLKLPDGKEIYVFGYTDNPDGPAQVPGPTLTVNEGDTVNLTLVDDKDPTKTDVNKDGDGHTIHLHGLDLPSRFDGDPMVAPGQHSIM